MRLITYLPVSRLGDLTEYFETNIELLKPSEVLVYVDNVFDCDDLNLPLRFMDNAEFDCVDYGNRGETVLRILEDVLPGDVIVDSDVVLDKSFIKAYEKAMSMDAKLIGIADINGKPSTRDVVKGGIPYTRILYTRRGYSPVFFGPKQAIIINHDVDVDVVMHLHDVMIDVPKAIRNCIADETILGLYALLVGQLETPWFPIAYNAGLSKDACGGKLRAFAHYMLFKSLIRHGIYIAGLNNYVQLIRYYLSWVL